MYPKQQSHDRHNPPHKATIWLQAACFTVLFALPLTLLALWIIGPWLTRWYQAAVIGLVLGAVAGWGGATMAFGRQALATRWWIIISALVYALVWLTLPTYL